MSRSGSEESYLLPGIWQHGRYYASTQPEKYVFPIDMEELNRLDIIHKIFLLCRDGLDLAYALPTNRASRILDLGAGTGIWSIQVSEEHNVSALMAVDLNKIQPPMIPRNMTTVQLDLEESSWNRLLRDCDLIHLRQLYGSIRTDLWLSVYARIFDHLAPGGHMEHTEISWTPSWEGGEVPNPSALQEFCELYLDGLDRANRSGRVNSQHTKRMLEEAGYVDVREQTCRCFVNPCSNDDNAREIARWFNLILMLGLEAMALKPMIDYGHLSENQVRELCGRVKEEICILRFRAYVTVHTWKARRPLGNGN